MADINSGNYQHSIIKSFDETSSSLKTTLVNADVNINVDAFTDSIAIADVSGNKVTTTLVGAKRSLDVNVSDITISAANDSIAIGDGVNNAAILTAAPGTDTGQAAIAVRVISQLGAGAAGLTDTQLRATPVPVSGTVTTGGLTDTQIRATALPVSNASLPLPAGASTSALQTSGNASLASLDSKAPALGQALAAASVPVVLTSAQMTTLTPLTTIAVTGPLTDTQLRATAVPVSGTFFQGTQPISAASLPLPSGAATETTLAAINAKVPALGQALAAASTPVVLTAAQITTLTPLASVSVSNFPATQAVSGTFFQATQPVSAASLPLPSGASTETTLAALNTKVTAVNTGAVTVSTALPTGTNSIGTVVPPAITKGTQGTVGITVQRLNDAGRNTRHFMLDAFTAAPAVEAVQSVVQWYGNAAVAGTTQPAVVPAGKTLRLQSWTISTKSLATVGSAVVRIRVNTAGLGVLASPLVFSFEVGSRAGATTIAMTGGTDTLTGVFPEGLEIPAGSGLSFSMAGYGPAGALALQGVTRFQVHGYEY